MYRETADFCSMMTIKPYSIEVVGCVMKPLNQGGESRGVFLFEILLSETKGIKCKRGKKRNV